MDKKGLQIEKERNEHDYGDSVFDNADSADSYEEEMEV